MNKALGIIQQLGELKEMLRWDDFDIRFSVGQINVREVIIHAKTAEEKRRGEKKLKLYQEAQIKYYQGWRPETQDLNDVDPKTLDQMVSRLQEALNKASGDEKIKIQKELTEITDWRESLEIQKEITDELRNYKYKYD